MDKKQASAAGAKSAAAKEDPLAPAKRAFNEAVAKTNADQPVSFVENEEIVVEAVAHKPEAKPKPELKVETPKSDEKYKALEKQLAELTAKLQEKEKPKEEPKAAPDLDAVKAYLSEHFDTEESSVLSEALKMATAARDRRIEALEGLIQKAIEKAGQSAAKSNRSRLSKEYPHLKENDAAWMIVEGQARELVSGGKYDAPEDAFDAVVNALYGGVKAQAEEAPAVEASHIEASTPTQPSTAKREKKLTPKDKSWEVFKHLYKNPDDIGGAKRVAQNL